MILKLAFGQERVVRGSKGLENWRGNSCTAMEKRHSRLLIERTLFLTRNQHHLHLWLATNRCCATFYVNISSYTYSRTPRGNSCTAMEKRHSRLLIERTLFLTRNQHHLHLWLATNRCCTTFYVNISSYTYSRTPLFRSPKEMKKSSK